MHCAAVWQHSSNWNIKIVDNSIEHFLLSPSDFSSDDVLSCLWILFTNCLSVTPSEYFSNRTLEYLRHNFSWDRHISRQTDNSWAFYSQDLNPPYYVLKGELKDRVCENKPETREDITKKEIRQIPQEMLNRVMDNFNVRVAAVLSYSNSVHGTNIVLITEKV